MVGLAGGRADLVDLIVLTYDRPDLFIEEILQVPALRSWQLRACQEISKKLEADDRRIRVLIRTCHGAGKTFFAGAILLWFMVTRYNSRGLTTAPTWAQVESTLWPEIAKLYNRSLLRSLQFGRLLTTELDLGETWFAVGASSDRPENLEGQHSDYAAIRVIDEAKAVEPSVFEATEGLLNSPESLDLWISTPSIESGNFFDRDMGGDEKVIRAVVTIDDLISDPLMSQDERDGYAAWKQERIIEWGEDSQPYAMRALALYADNAEGALLPSSWLERASKPNWPELTEKPDWRITGPLVAGMDVAGSVDGDQNAVAIIAGPDEHGRIELRALYAWHERDTMKSKGRALAIAQEHKACLRVDTIGIGKGVYDSLAADNVMVESYRASEKPRDVQRFANRKAEDAWNLRQKYEKGLIRHAMPADITRKYNAQARSEKYEINQAGKVKLVDPEDSPDLLDAVIIACASPRVGFTTI